MDWTENPAVLRQARIELGATQVQLAERAGLTRSMIADIERGKIKLSEKRKKPIWAAIRAINREMVRDAVKQQPANLYDQLAEPTAAAYPKFLAAAILRERVQPSEADLRLHQDKMIESLLSYREISKALIQAYAEAKQLQDTHIATLQSALAESEARVIEQRSKLGIKIKPENEN